MRPRLLLSAIIVVAGLVLAPQSASAGVPRGFVGMMADGPFFYPGMNRGAELSMMASVGVQSIRVNFGWASMQPYSSFSKVPASQRSQYTNAGGVPTNFATTDQIVGLAAARGLTVLPIVQFAPGWDALHPGKPSSPPKSDAPFARFVAALARRYGTHGTFWAQNPGIGRVPIRTWQIWNEPHFSIYWSTQPFESSYVKLLRATRPALRAADRSARLALAGMANFSWQYLAAIYKIRGARSSFDYVAIHPYTATPAGVITIAKKVRAVMNRNGDRHKQILVTELSWPSAKGKARATFENATDQHGQAVKTAQGIRLLAKNRRSVGIAGFYYYNWIGNETMPGARFDQFNFAGLLGFINGRGPSIKPVFNSFKSAVRSIER
jgi:hypothetical protein